MQGGAEDSVLGRAPLCWLGTDIVTKMKASGIPDFIKHQSDESPAQSRGLGLYKSIYGLKSTISM